MDQDRDTSRGWWQRNGGAVRVLAIVVIILLLVAASAAVVWDSDDRSATYLDLLRVIVSWPSVIVVVLLIGGAAFRREVAAILNGVEKLTVRLAGAEMDLTRNFPRADDGAAPPPPEGPINAQIEEAARDRADGQRPAANGNADEDGFLRYVVQQNQQLREQANTNWFAYLRILLQPAPKRILVWLTESGGTPSEEGVYQAWSQLIPDRAGVHGVIVTLLLNDVLSTDGRFLYVTAMGKAFVQYLRRIEPDLWLLPAPAPMPAIPAPVIAPPQQPPVQQPPPPPAA